MRDGAVIDTDRTAPPPVEWDEIKTQLSRLATDLKISAAAFRAPFAGRFDRQRGHRAGR